MTIADCVSFLFPLAQGILFPGYILTSGCEAVGEDGRGRLLGLQAQPRLGQPVRGGRTVAPTNVQGY